MADNKAELTHVAGTFVIQAEGAFLNGAGLGDGEDRNVTIPKTFRDGKNEVPYVSAQAWKRWLRNTAVQEAGWPASEPQAIGWNPKGNVNKIAGQLNPVEFPEDDIFGYMRAQEGQGKKKAAEEEDEGEEAGTTRAIMRSSPFMASLLISLRSTGWKGSDEGFVHLTKFDPKALAEAELEKFLNKLSESGKEKKDKWKRLEAFGEKWTAEIRALVEVPDIVALREALLSKAAEKGVELTLNGITPLPYTTRFYNTHLQGIFCLDYKRLGVFWSIGDRVELEDSRAKGFLENKVIEEVTSQVPYSSFTQNGKLGRVYRLSDQSERRKRAQTLFKALSVLRGGAKQAQFGTDIAPKAIILAGLTCGNPIFNHLFDVDPDSGDAVLNIEALQEIAGDYSDRIVTPILIGIRKGYLKNESEVRALAAKPVQNNGSSVEIKILTPLEAANLIGELLP